MRKDKLGIWQCMLAATRPIFLAYLTTARRRASTDRDFDKHLRYHAKFFLVYFNHHLKEVGIAIFFCSIVYEWYCHLQVRRCADTCLSELVDAFPHLLWDGEVLSTALGLLEKLTRNLNDDCECRQSSLQMPAELEHMQIQLQVWLRFRSSR